VEEVFSFCIGMGLELSLEVVEKFRHLIEVDGGELEPIKLGSEARLTSPQGVHLAGRDQGRARLRVH